MKIALFVHCFFPDHFYGTETYTLELARNYRASGHDVTVVSAIFQGESKATDAVTRYIYLGIPVVCLDKNWLPHTRVKETYYQPNLRPLLEKILHELRPDVVHVTHLINHTAALLEVTRQMGIATYATFTDFFGFCLNNKLEAANGQLCAGPSRSRTNCVACHFKDASKQAHAPRWMRTANTPLGVRALAECANLARRIPGVRTGPLDGLVEDIARRPETLARLFNSSYAAAVAPTQFLKSAYESNGIQVPIRHIHFGVDINRGPKPVRPLGHTPVIGYIGQIAPHKGTDILVEAFRRLPRQSAILKIFGPVDQDPAFMHILREMANVASIEFLGTFSHTVMREVLDCLDLLVIPSRWYENSPLVLLNALATHTPVIVSDVAGMTEFLEQGKNGFSCRRGSVDDLENVLRNLLTDPEKLLELPNGTHYERTTAHMAAETLAIFDAPRASSGVNIPTVLDANT